MELLPRRIYWSSSIILVIRIMVISIAMDSIHGLPTDVFGWFLDTTLRSPFQNFFKLAVYTLTSSEGVAALMKVYNPSTEPCVRMATKRCFGHLGATNLAPVMVP